MKRITTLILSITEYDLARFEALAKECLSEAVEYGHNTSSFVFHITPCRNPRFFRVEIGEENTNIVFHDSYISFEGGHVLKGMTLDYTDDRDFEYRRH